jgi:hypothetical protein
MISRLNKILTFYDSEPTEILHGIIWLIFFPISYTLEHGSNFMVFVSIIIGFCSLYSTLFLSLKIRKTMSVSTFIMSIVAVMLFFRNGDYNCPTHWFWFILSISAFFNSRRILNHYYRKSIKHGNP